jgi:hypothetical protein
MSSTDNTHAETDSTDLQIKRQELEELRSRLERLEADLIAAEARPGWQATEYYSAYYATAGFLMGIFGAVTSLVFNIVGAVAVGKSPLELIRVYLTFPLGEKALQLAQGQKVYAVDDGVILAFGCCLYLGTGMVLGIPVYMALTRFSADGGLPKRLLVASLVSLAIWAFNFYAILSWLQPLLIGGDPGNWITNSEYLPWWVAAATHLVFGWTIALLYPLGEYHPYRRPTERRGNVPG